MKYKYNEAGVLVASPSLEDDIQLLQDYLLLKAAQRDWHEVIKVAADLVALEAQTKQR